MCIIFILCIILVTFSQGCPNAWSGRKQYGTMRLIWWCKWLYPGRKPLNESALPIFMFSLFGIKGFGIIKIERQIGIIMQYNHIEWTEFTVQQKIQLGISRRKDNGSMWLQKQRKLLVFIRDCHQSQDMALLKEWFCQQRSIWLFFVNMWQEWKLFQMKV